MKTTKQISITSRLTALVVVALTLNAAAKDIPAQLPDPDAKPPAKDKPVKVYLLSGQSSMVGMGDISGGTSRWGPQILNPVVSVSPNTRSTRNHAGRRGSSRDKSRRGIPLEVCAP